MKPRHSEPVGWAGILQRFKLLRPYSARIALGYALLLVTSFFQLLYPHAIAYFVDKSVAGTDTAWLAWAAAGMAGVLLVHALAIGIRHYLFASTGSMVVSDLRNAFFGAVVDQPIEFFDAQSVGELGNRLSVDIEQLQEALTVDAAMFAQTFVIAVGAGVMLFVISPSLSLLVLVLTPVVFFSMRLVGARARALSKMKQERLAHCGRLAQEVLANIRLVHAFTQEQREKRRFGESTASALGYALSGDRLFAGLESGATFVQCMALLATVLAGGALVADGSLSLGEFTSFLLYAGMAAGSATSLGGLWGQWMRTFGATDRVFELLNRAPGRRPRCTAPVARLDGPITFDSVGFRYPGRPERSALAHFSLTIAPGEKVALVGASGAGKSTVVNLLLGFYRPTAGRILIDGVDMAELDLSDVRTQIAVVEQEPALFSTSVQDNIRYGAEAASDDQVGEAARHANVHEFVSRFADGYGTAVGARGMQLSGGQKQRVAVARALVRNPKLLVLDEATSALDAESEGKVQAALEHLMKGRTTIIIAHRLSTIAFADRIVVLKEGEIVQCGSHRELMRLRGGYYHRLVTRQTAGMFDDAFDVGVA